MEKSYFFYDLETSGLSPREDRIMQFAGQRTTMELEPLGEPVNVLVKLNDDTLPSPYAIMTTGITPQATLADGMTEAELAHFLQEEIFVPGTVAVGYNSVRFDDEFLRHLFWRTFYDAYEWQWADGRSRWDLLDVVRMTRALRPEGINWPMDDEGRATNRLELLTKENGIAHENAHDALSDVNALIAVAKLMKEKQPQLYEYLFKMRGKREVQKLVNLEEKKPFVYASGRYAGEFEKTTVAFPLAPGRNGNVLVFDLRYNLEELLAGGGPAGDSRAPDARKGASEFRQQFFPIVKELAYNKCPAVAPLGVLEQGGGWERVGLDVETVKKNLHTLLKHPEFAERMRSEFEKQPDWGKPADAESALYDGFLPEPDRVRCDMVRNASAEKLADMHPAFVDERLSELLLHYKAKNYPQSLAEDEAAEWEKYRQTRLNRQSESFGKAMEELSGLARAGKPGKNGKVPDEFLLEELNLYYQSLGGDY